MSTLDCDYKVQYKINDLESVEAPQLRALLKQAVAELQDVKLQFQEYECKCSHPQMAGLE